MATASALDNLDLNPFTGAEEYNTSVFATLERALILGNRLATIALFRALGVDEDPYIPTDPYQIERFIDWNEEKEGELEIEDTLATTRFGTDHLVRVINPKDLGNKPPIVQPLEYFFSMKGIKGPLLKATGEHCTNTDRSLIIIGSEGYDGRALNCRQLKDLSFMQMAHNVHDCVDTIGARYGVDIEAIETTGGSKGGLLSLLAADERILEQRRKDGLPDRKIEGITAFVVAGLSNIGFSQILSLLSEPMHGTRKASKMGPKSLIGYGRAILNDIPPLKSYGALAKTGNLFLRDRPLHGISKRIDPEIPTDIVLMRDDWLTNTQEWVREFRGHPNSIVFEFPGFHFSTDSVRRALGILMWHLDGRDMSSVIEAIYLGEARHDIVNKAVYIQQPKN